MANTVYPNFYLENEIEDQYNSHLDLQNFFKVDNTLEGAPGMTKIVNVYSGANGAQKLAQGVGNTQTIGVSYTPKTYNITLAQSRFEYYDEEVMKDPMLVPTGLQYMGVNMFNTVNADVYAELANTTLSVELGASGFFGAFADAVAKMNIENLDDVTINAFVSASDLAAIRKGLKDTLQYVEAFARTGYVGTVCGVNVYTKKDATQGTIYVAANDAVTVFNKRGMEIESLVQGTRGATEANTRLNTIFARKYYVAALTDATKVVAIDVNP